MSFQRARKIADAVLYEGYVLYPYRASARKNRIRWQFGVLAPRRWSEAGGCEEWWMRTECLVEAKGPFSITGKARFLQVQERRLEAQAETGGAPAEARGASFVRVESLEADGRLWTSWDEGVEREVDFSLTVHEADPALDAIPEIPFAFPGGEEIETITGPSGALRGRAVRERRAIAGAVILSAARITGSRGLFRISVRIENRTPGLDPGAAREDALRGSLIGVHTLLAAEGGAFVSLLDPPDDAREAAAGCANVRTWPVLAGEPGERGTLLSSPIILYDHPQIAPESPGDLYDGTEIDEILTLRTMALTDEEKREARATDGRAAAIIDRVDSVSPEVLERLHGTVRPVSQAPASAPADAAPSDAPGANAAAAVDERPPWWDPGADASVSPETDQVVVDGVVLSRGSRVRLRPALQRADAQDMFLEGRVGRIEGVFFDVESRNYLAVTLEDDPAAELMQWHGRYLYFSPDEVEPLGGSA